MPDILTSFMQKGVSPEAKARYQQHKAKAKEVAVVYDELVVLDTETTGLRLYSSELTEIAALRLSKGKIRETFQTYVATTQPIPPAITRLTGIKDEDVAGAPSPREAVAKLSNFVDGAPVLAHNASFDRGFIEAVEGGKNVTDTWIDSLALSRIAFPLLKTHKLKDMARAFEVDAVTHRALDDVYALAAIWPIMLAALSSYSPGLLHYLVNLHLDVAWSYRDIFKKLSESVEKEPFSLQAIRAELAEQRSQGAKKKKDAMETTDELQGVSKEEISAFFGSSGILSREIDSFETRPQQAKMSEAVAEALSSHTHLAVEVGTGVGKSLAYLVPLSLFAKKNGVTCGVSTKTNVLTDQIIEYELPRLAGLLPDGLTFASLKGFEHYPCFRKIESACFRALPDFETPYATAEQTKQEMLTALATTLTYASEFVDGDIDGLGIRWSMVPRALLSTTSQECQRTHCPYYRKGCMLHSARRRATEVDIVVTNHALLLCDIETERKILPTIRAWVIDEAHGFASEARKQWAFSINSDTFFHLLIQLGSRESGLLSRHANRLIKQESFGPALGLLLKAASFLEDVKPLADSFFEIVHEAVIELAFKNSYDQAELWINDDIRQTPIYAKLCVFGEGLVQKLSHAEHALVQYSDCLQDTEGSMLADLAPLLSSLSAVRLTLETFFSHNRDNRVFSLSASQSRKKNKTVPECVCVQELFIGPLLKDRLYEHAFNVTYCSGTLAAGKNFSHFENAVGLDLLNKEEYRTLQLDSPYDLDSHLSAIAVQSAPEPGSSDYLDAMAAMLIDIHLAMEGSVLTLFTNRREMEAIYKLVQPVLEKNNLKVTQQGRKTNARRLAQEFNENPKSSLFALRSFWEGFDASGDTLRCVVIPRLPFSSPIDPLAQERDAHDKAAFCKYSLPEAILSVKQAAGRLMRKSTDIGIVVLADVRVTTKAYGRQFLNALPMQHIDIVRPDELFDAIRDNLKRVERNR